MNGLTYLGVAENIFRVNGQLGHEIVFLYAGILIRSRTRGVPPSSKQTVPWPAALGGGRTWVLRRAYGRLMRNCASRLVAGFG